MLDNPAGGFGLAPEWLADRSGWIFKDGAGGIHGLNNGFLGDDIGGKLAGGISVAGRKLEGGGENQPVRVVLELRVIVAPVKIGGGNIFDLIGIKVEIFNGVEEGRKVGFVKSVDIGVNGTADGGGNIGKIF